MAKGVLWGAGAALLLAGCAGLMSQESLIADENWYQLGWAQGQRGGQATAEAALNHQIQAVDTRLRVDYPAYLRGYHTGLTSYCSLEKMRQLGLARQTDWGVCEFRRQDGQLFRNFWQQGFDRSLAGADGW